MSHNAGMEVGQTTGIITNPNLPAFFAYVASTITNVTGNSTVYTIVYDSERFDYGSNFNTTTGIFTAPVTGIYRFEWGTQLLQLGTANFLQHLFVTTAETYSTGYLDAGGIDSSGTLVTPSCSILADMTAADTARVQIQVNGTGADTADVGGNSGTMVTWFSGSLVR